MVTVGAAEGAPVSQGSALFLIRSQPVRRPLRRAADARGAVARRRAEPTHARARYESQRLADEGEQRRLSARAGDLRDKLASRRDGVTSARRGSSGTSRSRATTSTSPSASSRSSAPSTAWPGSCPTVWSGSTATGPYFVARVQQPQAGGHPAGGGGPAARAHGGELQAEAQPAPGRAPDLGDRVEARGRRDGDGGARGPGRAGRAAPVRRRARCRAARGGPAPHRGHGQGAHPRHHAARRAESDQRRRADRGRALRRRRAPAGGQRTRRRRAGWRRSRRDGLRQARRCRPRSA